MRVITVGKSISVDDVPRDLPEDNETVKLFPSFLHSRHSSCGPAIFKTKLKVLCLRTVIRRFRFKSVVKELELTFLEKFELGKASKRLVKRNPVIFLFSSLLFELFV